MLKNFFTFGRFTLFVALCISAIAAYYSVVGLTAIFAGAVIPIIVMGAILEIAKITTTVWLHRYWSRAGWGIKIYLTAAVIALACLTSMGIFGLLSKAHSDTGLVSGDVAAQVSIIDEKIKTQRDNIDTARKALQQMDDQVNQRLSRSDSEQGAERAVQIRRQQAPERARLQKEIGDAQIIITKLNDERAPIAASQRKVEAEVGPIKYIAALIYGDNPDSNLLERAVRWVIIMIVVVFDPLAIILILAANNSIKWEKEIVVSKPEPLEFVSELESTKETESMPESTQENETVPISDNDESSKTEESASIQELTIMAETEQPVVTTDHAEDSVINFSQGNYQSTYTILEPKFNFAAADKQVEENKSAIIGEVEPEIEVKSDVDIKTENVTKQVEIFSTDDEYVTFDGKKISVEALRQLRPELVVNGPIKNNILFGSKFPAAANSGDVHTRVDVMPHRTYKFNGTRWIQINRQENTSYLQNIAYVQYLISKIDSGEYDPELLTSAEQDEISDYLTRSV